ncbi:MAG: glycosyltransferase family 39 protein [Opitutaceae bacterium]|nr:glycosyltransferase family 39 protein [Opitutaceae bacterium]
MPSPLSELLRTAPVPRVLLLLAAAAVSVYVGFLAFSPQRAQTVVHDWGYYLIAATFGWFLLALFRLWRERRTPPPATAAASWRGCWQQLRMWMMRPAVLAVAGMSTLCVIAERPREKILYDEQVIQATAMYMHHTRQVSTVVRGYDVNGVFLPLTHYLDKRPYFFALLLSLLHDVTGYRLANAYVLNAILTVLTLALLYVVVRRLTGPPGGILAVLLFGTLPLLAQNTSGAGIEVLNLAMILLCVWLGMLAAERPTETALGAFVLAVVLLTQVRYESALYVVACALVFAGIWRRTGRLLLPWAAVVAPLLLIPIPLLQLVLSANRVMWDLPENLDSRFGLMHLGSNLEHAARFLSSFSREHPNSPLLVLLGVAGAAGCGWWALRHPDRLAAAPDRWAAASFTLVILGNFGLLMFYFWGELDDPMVSRLALPLYLLLAGCAAVGLGFLDRFRPATRWGIVAALAALPLSYGRATPLHLYSSQNLTAAELQWEQDWLAARGPGARLVITNKSSLPWMLRQEPALLISNIRDRQSQLAFHLHEGTFTEILVMQRLRATTPLGQFAVDPADRLPEVYELETLAEKRFGASLDRISRLRAVRVPAPEKPAP